MIDDHDKWAAAKSEEFLQVEGVESDRIEAIKHCIEAHSIRSSSPEPEILEAKLLFDADKMEAAGARDVIRLACIIGEIYGRAGEKYAIIDDLSVFESTTLYSPDIELLRNWTRERLDLLYTSPVRRLGTSRWDFIDKFFSQFERETGIEGEK